MTDHVRTGTYFRRFVNPPGLPTEEELKIFGGEELTATAKGKLAEFTQRAKEVDDRYQEWKDKIDDGVINKGWDEKSEWFWSYYAGVEHGEMVYIQKWLRYWLWMLEKSSGQKNVLREEYEQRGVNQEDIAKAKMFPIEQMYQGDLRELGNRLTGLCPFHDENTPSFTIFTDDNHYYCFGCNDWGDAIDYYMKKNEVDMIEAVKALT